MMTESMTADDNLIFLYRTVFESGKFEQVFLDLLKGSVAVCGELSVAYGFKKNKNLDFTNFYYCDECIGEVASRYNAPRYGSVSGVKRNADDKCDDLKCGVCGTGLYISTEFSSEDALNSYYEKYCVQKSPMLLDSKTMFELYRLLKVYRTELYAYNPAVESNERSNYRLRRVLQLVLSLKNSLNKIEN